VEDSPKSEKREPRIEMTIRGDGSSMKELHRKMERAIRHKGRGGRKMRRSSHR
jgi:hypothetical protein